MVGAGELGAVFEFLGESAGDLSETVLFLLENGRFGVAKRGENGKEDGQGEDNDQRAKKNDLPAEAQA
jgi:hypothetical protein